jgi:ATP-dependent DNA helicase RecQ
LREYRTVLAKEQGVPPYVVLHDTTLREIALHKPRCLDELAELPGIGVAKLERYGAGILAIVENHAERHD